MNRAELVVELQNRIGKRKPVVDVKGNTKYTLFSKEEIAEFVDAYEASVLEAVRRGERVYLHNFMRIDRKTKKAHQGYDFQNKRMIPIPERETIVVELGKSFSRLLNKTTE